MPATIGEIAKGRLYTLDELKQRLGWSTAAMRTARRNGLVVRYSGNRGYVLGDDAIEYIVTKSETTR